MIGHSLRPLPSASGIWTSHLRTPSAWHLACPFERSCFGTDWASLIHTVTTKLLAYEVHVYLAPCPHHACDSSTSYSYCASGFYSSGDSSTSSYFCHVPYQVPTGDPPLSLSDRGPDPDSVLPDHVPHQGHRRGLAAVAFWLSSAVPHLAGTDISLSFDRNVADVGGPGLLHWQRAAASGPLIVWVPIGMPWFLRLGSATLSIRVVC